MTVKIVHVFEDTEGNEFDLTETTYEVLQTYVEPDEFAPEPTIVFTHVVKIRPSSLDIEMMFIKE